MADTSQLTEDTKSIPLFAYHVEEGLFANDPLLSAIGLHKDLWADEHADEYVANLRKDW